MDVADCHIFKTTVIINKLNSGSLSKAFHQILFPSSSFCLQRKFKRNSTEQVKNYIAMCKGC